MWDGGHRKSRCVKHFFFNRFCHSSATIRFQHLAPVSLDRCLPSAALHPCPSYSTEPKPCVSNLAFSIQPPSVTVNQVRTVLRKLHARKASGPDDASPKHFKTCAAEQSVPLYQVYNLSLRLGKVPSFWKTSYLISVPKKGRASDLNYFRAVALTSHVMKTHERLVLQLVQPQVQCVLDPSSLHIRCKRELKILCCTTSM